MSEKENTQSLIVEIPAAFSEKLKIAADSQGITVEEAAANAVESYLRMFDELFGENALEDDAVQAMMRSIYPDREDGRRGVVLNLPGTAPKIEE